MRQNVSLTKLQKITKSQISCKTKVRVAFKFKTAGYPHSLMAEIYEASRVHKD